LKRSLSRKNNPTTPKMYIKPSKMKIAFVDMYPVLKIRESKNEKNGGLDASK
jgi:hypothetical protein